MKKREVIIIFFVLLFSILFISGISISGSSEQSKTKGKITYGYNWDQIDNGDGTYTRKYYAEPIYLDKFVNLTESGDDLLLEWKGNKIKIKLNIKEKGLDIQGKPKVESPITSFKNENITYNKTIIKNRLNENQTVDEYGFEFSWQLETKDRSNFSIDYFTIELENLTDMEIKSDGIKFYLPDGLFIDLKDLHGLSYTTTKLDENKVKITAEKKDNFITSKIDLDPTVSKYTSKDTYIADPPDEDENNGGDTILVFTDTTSKALIDFDISDIPSNSSVTNADVYLRFSSASSGDTKYAYPITKSWNEGNGDSVVNDADINGTTWVERWYGDNANDGCSGDSDPDWCTSGLGTSDYNTTYVSSFTGGTGYQSFDVTNVINMSVNGKWNFYGWVIVNQDGSGHGFYSKEQTGTSYDPYISITYSYPEPDLTISPSNGTIQSSNTLNVVCNATLIGINSNSNITEIDIDIWNSSSWDPLDADSSSMAWVFFYYNETTEQKPNHTISQNYSIVLPDGYYNYYCGGSVYFAESDEEVWTQGWDPYDYMMLIDSSSPEITYESPTPTDSSRQKTNSITVNVSLSDLSSIDTCLLEWNNTATITNYTMTKNGNYCNYTISTTDGTQYWFKVYANDSINNLGNTSIRTFTENTAPSTPSTVSLTPQSPYSNSTLTCSASGSDDSESDTPLIYFYRFNDTDGSILQDWNVTGSSTVADDTETSYFYDYYVALSDGDISGSFDENWDIADSLRANPSGMDTLYINYTIPSNLSNAIWEIKHDIRVSDNHLYGHCKNQGTGVWIQLFDYNTCAGAPCPVQQNYTLNSACFGADTMELMINLTATASNGFIYLFEEQINWNVSLNTFNCSAYASCTKDDNISCEVRVFDGYEYSTINSSTITILNYPPNIASWNISNDTWSTDSGTDINIYENATNGTYTFNVTDVEDIDSGETHWYHWFVDGISKFVSSVQSWWNWVLGSDDVGEHNVTVIVNDSSGDSDSQYWNITIIDNNNPSLIVDSPISGKYYNYNTSLNLNYTTFDVHPDSCWYSIDSGATNTTLTCGTNETFNISEGSQTLYIWVNDTSNNLNSTSVSFTTDLTNPLISMVYPQNTSYTSDITVLNYTVSDTNLDSCWYSTNAGSTNATITCGQNVTGLSANQGSNTWLVGSNDSAGNINQSIITFFVDSQAPSISITYPSSDGLSFNSHITVNYTASDVGLQSCWWTNDAGSTNTTLASCGTNITGQTWDQGGNTVTVYANDTLGNKNSSTRVFNIDTIIPAVTNLQEPTDPATYIYNAVYQFNATITDTNLGTVLLEFGGINYTASNLVGDIYNVTFLNLGVDTYNYRWYVNDSYGNINNSEIGSYTINKANPSFLTSVTSPITYGSASDYSGSESNNGDTGCTYILTRAGTQIDTGSSVGDTSVLGADTYEYNYSTSGCTNYNAGSTTDSLTVDKAIPQGSLTSSGGWTIESGTEVIIGLSESNSGDVDVDYNISRDGVDKGTGETWTPDVGTYDYILNTTGGANWTSNSSMDTQTLTVQDTVNPVVTISYPDSDNNWYDYHIEINWSYTEINKDTCKWSKDSGATNTTLASCENITGQTWSQGETTVIIYVNDSSGNEGSDTVVFNIDTVYPDINLIYPTNISYTSIQTELNYTASDTNMGVCWYSLDGGSTNSSSQTCGTNWTGLNSGQGSSTWTVYVNDSVGNENSSSVTFFVDSILPITTIIYPTNTSYAINVSDLNYTYTETNCDKVWYSIDLGVTNSSSVSCGTNFTSVTSSEESNTWILYINDTYGNENSSSITFFKDTTNPLIDYGTGTAVDYANLSQSNVYVNVSWTETNFANITFTLKNDTDTINSTTFISSTYTINWIGLADNNYTYWVNITDTLNNKNSTDVRYITLDTTNPDATLIFPENNTYNSTTDQNFTYNASDNDGLKNATLYIYNESGEYNVTITNFEPNALEKTVGIVVNLIEGIYKWWVKVWDWAGNTFTTGNYTITIDTTNPSVSYNSNTDGNGTWKQTGDIFINITASDTNKDTVRLEWQGVNETFDNSGGDYYWENKTGLSTGTYNFYAWANDSAGNFNSTDIRTIYIDLENPSVTIDDPNEGQSYNNNVSLAMNYIATDTNLQSCWWNIDGESNQSITCGQNATFNTSEASHTITVYANDSSGRVGLDSVNFIVNLAPPSVTLNFPLNNRWLDYKTDITFNYTPSDTSLDSCEFYINSTGSWHLNQTDTSPTTDVINTFTLSLNEGSYIWNIWCNDSGGNGAWMNSINNITLNIDTIYPLINYDSGTPSDDLNTTSTNIYVDVSVTEINEDTITFNLYDSSHSSVNSTFFTDSTRSINWTSLSDDTYYYNVTINDSAGNSNTTETRLIRLDDTGPDITIDYPKTINYAYNDSLNLNFTITDNIVGIDSCWYKIENMSSGYIDSIVIDNTTLTNCQNTTFGVPSGDIDYSVTIYANDTLGNEESYSSTFGVRTIAPAVVLGIPDDYFFNTETNIILNTTSTDDDGISSCKLYGNWTGSWHNNQTKTSITSGTSFNWDSLNLSEGVYLWNVWCNDTYDNEDFALNNLTFGIDITYPLLNITSPINASSFTGLSTVIRYNISDTHINTCFFTLRNESGDLHNYAENTSLICSEEGSRAISTTSYGTYTFYLYGRDKAGNENYTIVTFTNSAPSVPPGGGGGGGFTPPTEKIPAVGLKEIGGSKEYDELERMIIYAKINSFCSLVKTEDYLAIQDFSGRCSLTLNNLKNISQEIINLGFTVPQEDMILFFDKYSKRELFQGFATEDQIRTYGLFTSVLGITNPMAINPPSLDRPFVIYQSKGNKTISYSFSVNKNIRECTVTSETPEMSCQLITNTTFKVSYYIQDVNFLDKIFRGQISVTSDAKPENLEVKSVSLTFRVYNLTGSKLNIPLWMWVSGIVIILTSVILLLSNKKVRSLIKIK